MTRGRGRGRNRDREDRAEFLIREESAVMQCGGLLRCHENNPEVTARLWRVPGIPGPQQPPAKTHPTPIPRVDEHPTSRAI